ncbi:MAG: hypothetical protein WC121_00040 [Candidatus Kapaibacterium sp.]
MKKQQLTLTALLVLSLMLFSCSDDDTGTTPEEKEDVTYYNNEINSYTYNEYDLDSNNVEISETSHQDSLSHTQETTKDRKTASEFMVFTNIEGSYMEDGTEFYAGETNKLYAHLSVFQGMFANIESNGFTLSALFDSAGDWFLIADAKATSTWTLFDGKINFDLPILGSTDADVKITMKNDGTNSVTINGKASNVDVYTYTANIKATTNGQVIDIDVRGSFWVAPNIGIVKSNVYTFNVPLIGDIEGTERVLVNYTLQEPVKN